MISRIDLLTFRVDRKNRLKSGNNKEQRDQREKLESIRLHESLWLIQDKL